MNDVSETPAKARHLVVRPRDAASLILLRGEGKELEVLAGRRPLHVRFMPGVHVFPGGAIDPPDRVSWNVESGSEGLGPKLARSARAALRETWEEVGVAGRSAGRAAFGDAGDQADRAGLSRARPRGGDGFADLCRAGDHPSHSNRRFNTRFFLSDGGNVFGEPAASEELEDVRWHPIGRHPLESFRDVTRFMLARAIALRSGTATGGAPLFYWAKNARRSRRLPRSRPRTVGCGRAAAGFWLPSAAARGRHGPAPVAQGTSRMLSRSISGIGKSSRRTTALASSL